MDITKLLTPTQKLFEAIEVYKVDMNLKPPGEHFASNIKIMDFKFNKAHLIERLREAIIRWVFSRSETERIFNEAYGADGDHGTASTALYTSARETIRVSAPQGQFGELLLSAFLQHLFHAAPLLRKQPVRTSDNHERFGADAIHVSTGTPYKIFLGESKCYKSSYTFNAAFQASLESICGTIENFEQEIKKFRTGDFIEDELKGLAGSILKNEVIDLEIHPVCIIIYNETQKLTGIGSKARQEEIKKAILARCKNVPGDVFTDIDESALDRFIYIIFPVWELEKLLDEFVQAL